MVMWGKIKRRLGKWGTAGVGTVIVSIAIGIAPEILPYTGYPISQNAARGLFWASIVAGIFGIALIIYALAWNRQPQAETTVKESEYNHNAHVTKLITDDKAESLLALRPALQTVGELDIELTYQLGKKKRAKATLKKIQNRLQEDWEIQLSEGHEDLSQIIRNTVYQTIKVMNLSDDVNEETMGFMLHLAGVLDDEGIGISARREKDNRYKSVTRLQAKIATQELNDTVIIYLYCSLGFNSLLLFISYWPIEATNLVMSIFGKTSTELRAEREQTLHSILTRVSELVEKELYKKGEDEL